MGEKKKLFASLRYIVPSELEEFLEQQASEGMILRFLSEGSLFYFTFASEEPEESAEGADGSEDTEDSAVKEKTPEKIKYAVDCTGLSKALYMETLINKGWEYSGRTMNCYIWKKRYTGLDRPEDFTDKAALKKHCLVLGVLFFLFAAVILSLWAVMIWEMVKFDPEIMKNKIPVFIVSMVIQLPVMLYMLWAGYRLIGAAERYGKMEGIVKRTASSYKETMEEIAAEEAAQDDTSDLFGPDAKAPKSIFGPDEEEPASIFDLEKDTRTDE